MASRLRASSPLQSQSVPDRAWTGAYLAAALLGIVLLAPSGINYVFATDSHAPGTAIASGLILLGLIHLLRAEKIMTITLVVAMLIVGHLFVASMFGPVDYRRGVQSLILFIGLLVAASCFGSWLFRLHDQDLVRAVAIVRWVMVAIAIVSIAGFAPPGGAFWEKPVFPFTEPSHFALSFAPLLIEACVRNDGWRRLGWLLLGFTLAYFLENLSLVGAVVIAALVSLPISRPLPWIVAIAAAVTLFNLDYFAERLDFEAYDSSFGTNLSVLIYVQGWELMLGSVEQAHGWGVGFQQLGVGHINSGASDQIYRLIGQDLNIQDGGFVSAKIVSEFGIFGLAAGIAFIVLAIRFGLRLRRIAGRPELATVGYVFALCAICGFTLDMFFRGLSYFSSSSLLFVSACFYIRSLKREFRGRALAQAPSLSPGRPIETGNHSI